MAERYIYECPVALPSLARAKAIAPEGFAECYDWFEESAGQIIPHLPHRMENKPAVSLALSRDSGIHSPTKKKVSYLPGRRYALSVHGGRDKKKDAGRKYEDHPPITLPDGTWILDYAAYEGDAKDQQYNEWLLSCLEDGLPVGVIVPHGNEGHLVLGLAYVERYNDATRTFTLHGPITAQTEAAHAFEAPGIDMLPAQDQQFLLEFQETDDRRIVITRQVRREQQGRFREEVMAAYGGACAITGTSVPEVLQAAHINPYRGRRSQVVNNGILLRADLHLLYDARLVSIEPDDLSLRLSAKLEGSEYLRYNHRRLRATTRAAFAPNQDLLAMHYEQFRQENPKLVA